jgi:hypothetical protein
VDAANSFHYLWKHVGGSLEQTAFALGRVKYIHKNGDKDVLMD